MNRKMLAGLIVICLIISIGLAVTGEDIQVKAYREINFGDSQETVKEKIKDDPGLDLGWHYNITEDTDTIHAFTSTIGKLRHSVIFHFFGTQMYQVRISSPDRSANYFDSQVRYFRNQFVDIIKTRYGDPSWTREVSFFEIESGSISWSHLWKPRDIGETKRIAIGFSVFEYEYEAELWVSYPPLVEAKKQAEKEEKQKSTEETAEDF